MEIGLELSNGGRIMLWRTLDRQLMSVGRNPECDLCVPDEAVAPIQLLLRLDSGGVSLLNRHPDGTRAADELVTDELKLANGDAIELGPLVATVRFREGHALVGGKTRTLTHPDAAPTSQVLVGVQGQAAATEWELTAAGLTIGNEPTNDIILDDSYVSGFHAQLRLENGRCFVRDLDSRNGVFIAGQQVREAEVPLGSQVTVGQSTITVRANDAVDSDASSPTTPFVGSSAVAKRVRDIIGRLAPNDAPVLITGETGTGKEIAAKMLVDLSHRADGPFVPINCGTLGPSLIGSELFGHEKGAFTGAVARKPGAFESADGGTLFLDEIGELPLELQPQLLRVVEYGEVRRIGAEDTLKVDVRLVAATNRFLDVEVSRGGFREDLFHRLHVLTVELPPLRSRKDDIPELTRFFLAQATPEGEKVTLSDAAFAKLIAHDWPGNVRELRNVIHRAVLMRLTDVLDEEAITFAPSTLATRVQAKSATSSRTLAQIEREAIVAELVRHKGNKKEAAATLGVSRSTVHRKIDEFAIDVPALLGRRGR